MILTGHIIHSRARRVQGTETQQILSDCQEFHPYFKHIIPFICLISVILTQHWKRSFLCSVFFLEMALSCFFKSESQGNFLSLISLGGFGGRHLENQALLILAQLPFLPWLCGRVRVRRGNDKIFIFPEQQLGN